MLEVFLFVVTVILVVLFWPVFLALALVAVGLVVLAVVGVLAVALVAAYPKVALAVAVLGLVAWAVFEIILDSGAYQSWADQRTRRKGPEG